MNDNAAAIESEMIWLEFTLKMIGFSLVLGAIPVLEIYFRRRRERRLTSGWKLVPNTSRVMKTFDRLSNMFFAFYLWILIVNWLHISPSNFLVLAFVLQMITIREKWVAPGSANEPDARIEPQ